MDEREYIKRAALGHRKIHQRMKSKGFVYPFGAYPEEPFDQNAGFDSRFMEDRGLYYYEIAVSHEKVLGVFLSLLRLLPKEAHVLAQVYTDDYFREYDNYISEFPVSMNSLLEWVLTWREVVSDDGYFAIGALSEDPDIDILLDTHKIIHMNHHDPSAVEATLEKLGIPFKMGMGFFPEVAHEHVPLPIDNEEGEDFLSAFEDLADRYSLALDEDESDDFDEDGEPLGVTCWRVDVRGCSRDQEREPQPKGFYSTFYLNATSRLEAAGVLESYMDSRNEYIDLYLQMARVPMELLTRPLREANENPGEQGVWFELDRVEFEWEEKHD